MSTLKIFLAASMLTLCVRAQDNPVEQKSEEANLPQIQDTEATEQREVVAGIEKNDRDPFWPVDYLPQDEQREQTQEKQSELDSREMEKMARRWNDAESMLQVSGFSRMGDEGYFAIVNGEMVRTGDTATVQTSEGSFYWKITAIDDDGIRFKRMRMEMK